jgi:membrane peptidoglycan carboxypeptidase
VQLLNWTANKTSSVGRIIVLAGLAGVLVAAMALPVVAATGILVRNTTDKFTALSVTSSTIPARSAIYDSDGKLITYVYGVDLGSNETAYGIDRTPVTYAQISPNMTTAIVAIEDDRFWTRGALDTKGTLRALVNDLEHKPIQGGSTLEQQYVKNEVILEAVEQAATAPSETAYQNDLVAAQNAATAQTLTRKIDQLRMAVQIAHTMSKPQILAGYLNDAYYGEGAYGIEAAAETYFNTTAAKLTMDQAATLAGIVENPAAYDPMVNPATSLERRNTVLARITQTNPTTLSPTAALALENQKLVLHPGTVQSGCTASTVGDNGFFCDDVIHTLLQDNQLGATPEVRAQLLATGGLQIHTTVSEQDEAAATQAVNHVLPDGSKAYNAAGNAATEVLIQPGTGQVLAVAEDRPYGTGPGQTEIDYAVNTQYGGEEGVQTGSSSKLFTLITALNEGVPLGSTMTVSSPSTVTGYTNCQGGPTQPFKVVNSEGVSHNTTYSVYTATAESINVYFAQLEKKVGLCNVVKTAANLGVTRVDGSSLLAWDGPENSKNSQSPADDDPSFTLGTVDVSPMSMAAAYAVPASGGMYCAPVILTKITDEAGKSLPVPSAGCHRVISPTVAEAVNYILQGVFTFPGATAQGGGLSGYQAAGKTGTSNIQSGDGTPYAAFAGYTTALAGYVSVFYPPAPTSPQHAMAYQTACYQLESGGADCPAEMFGDNAPHEVWHMTFDHANLNGSADFPQLSPSSPLLSQGNGKTVQQPCQPAKGKGKNANNANNNANCANPNGGTQANAAAATNSGTTNNGGPGNGGPNNGGPANGGPNNGGFNGNPVNGFP